MTDAASVRRSSIVDVVIIGGGPAGLSAALNLGRARAAVRASSTPAGRATPRRCARTASSPATASRRSSCASSRAPSSPRTRPSACSTARVAAALAAGRMPATACASSRRCRAVAPARRRPSRPVRSSSRRDCARRCPRSRACARFYGMSLFSCAACDAWELQDRPLALIGETPDLADRARLIARWTDRLTVFTNGADVIDTVEEAELAASGIVVERRRIADLEGDRGAVSAVRLADGTRSRSRAGSSVRSGTPRSTSSPALDVDRDARRPPRRRRSGRTSVAGLYAAGDAAAPGPQQLIVAAGQGARAAAVLVHDSVGVRTAH